MFNEVADIEQFDSVNSQTFKNLWNEIQGLSSTCPVFKDFQGLEFRIKKSSTFKDAWEPCSKGKARRQIHNHLIAVQLPNHYITTSKGIWPNSAATDQLIL